MEKDEIMSLIWTEEDLKEVFKTPNLGDWFSRDAVSFWDAAILSYGYCPNAVFEFHPHKYPFLHLNFLPESCLARKYLDDFKIRTKSTITSFHNDSLEFKTAFSFQDTNHIDQYMVNLNEFRNWTIDRNLKIDDDFRNFQKNDYERKIGGISLKLPYRNSFIEALAEITWRFYGNPEIAKNIQQKIVIDELVEVYGWDERYVKGQWH